MDGEIIGEATKRINAKLVSLEALAERLKKQKHEEARELADGLRYIEQRVEEIEGTNW
jgi:hypothetical protein